jgi:acetyl-CoA carboxylase biotin carboxyl carrier protein
MDPQQIKAFIDAMAASDLAEMEVSHDGWRLRLVRHAGAQPASRPVVAETGEPRRVASAAPASVENNGPQEVRAPMFGVVHWQQAPDAAPFVKVGDLVEAGQMLCTIEAMKVFNELRAERAGRVAALLVASGSEVEAGQPLLTLEQVQHV